MIERSRGSRSLPLLRRAGLAATALLCLVGLVALLAGGAFATGAFVAVATLLPSALILVGAPVPRRPQGGALAAALVLGLALLATGMALALGAVSLGLLLVGLGLGPLIATLALYTLRFPAEQRPDEDALRALRRLGEDR